MTEETHPGASDGGDEEMGPARASPALLGLINSFKATQRPPGTQLIALLAESSHRDARSWPSRTRGDKER